MAITYEQVQGEPGKYVEITTTTAAGETTIRRRTVSLSDLEAAVASEIASTERQLNIATEALSALRTKQAELVALRSQ